MWHDVRALWSRTLVGRSAPEPWHGGAGAMVVSTETAGRSGRRFEKCARECGLNVIQRYFKKCTLEERSSAADHSQCTCSSPVVQAWLRYESGEARVWFRCGSSVLCLFMCIYMYYTKCGSGILPSRNAAASLITRRACVVQV